MIEYKIGDILKENVEAVINTVNCVGIMGRGLALQFKKKFPDNFKAYELAVKNNEIHLGKMFVFDTHKSHPRYIINFPTKNHWRGNSKLSDIEKGLESLLQEIKTRNISSIAIPPLGCGLGGLEWSNVKPLIEKTFKDCIDLKVIVFEPQKSYQVSSNETLQTSPTMTPGRASLISLIDRYLKGLLDPIVTLLEVHKLMYFMQEAGAELRLEYKKALYGPYAENLRHVFKVIDGHMILGYGDGGDEPNKELSLVSEFVEKANSFLQEDKETLKRFDKVARLVDGFESPFGLELLATVHWVVTRENAVIDKDIISKVYNWSKRKQQFSEGQIMLAYERLKTQGWIANQLH